MFRVEITKSVLRVRTYVLGLLLAGVAVLPVVVLAASSGDGDGPPFFDLIQSNGLFAALTAVAIIQPFFLPLGTGLLSGETVADEAHTGTLRYLLVRPVGRVRLVTTKYLAVMTLLAAAVLWVALVGLTAGGLAFGFGPLPTLSGSTLTSMEGLLRVLAAAAHALVGVSGLAAIGVFFSTLTSSAPGAAIATTAVAIVSQILNELSALRPIHRYLLTHDWLAFVGLFRDPIDWSGIVSNAVRGGAYVAVFLSLALWVFSRKDVTS